MGVAIPSAHRRNLLTAIDRRPVVGRAKVRDYPDGFQVRDLMSLIGQYPAAEPLIWGIL